MSHNHLLDTYTYIQQRLNALEKQLTGADADLKTKHYAAGQIEALCDLDRFLKVHYDRRLPRRLRRQRQQTPATCTNGKLVI